MGIYGKYILPKVIDWTCKQRSNMKQREKIVPVAFGDVLEIGIGSGLNLKYYDQAKISSVTGIDPSEKMWNENKVNLGEIPFEFNFIPASAENIPTGGNQFDSILVTYSLCTIQDLSMAFEEFRRVIRPGGILAFCEHGIAPEKRIQKTQNFINPLWKYLGGGCNLNRDIPNIIEGNGFRINRLDTMYIPGWKPASFNYWGTASAY